MAECSACRHALPPDARFCPSCGAACAPPGPGSPDGRKVVTVLFCDLVGSTALSGALDPEVLRTVTLRYFDLMRQQIEAHGGTVEKFIGDAVMAVFGIPAVHEDDARRALAAALDMVDALDGLNAELSALLGVRLDVRIGINTGQVVAGADTSARQALVSGETVNVAARLEQNAAAGQILIGPDTLLAAGSTVRAEPVGPLLLKGKAEPVTAHRLLGLGEDDPELLRRFDVRFVGRRRQLEALDAVLADTAGGPRVRRVLVHGEAGQGKTRLLREWLRRTPRPHLHGAGRCRPYGEQGSLRPLADAVTELLAGAGPAGTAPGLGEALRLLSGGLLLDGTPTPSLDETCAALVRVLRALAARLPVVLVVDDTQWAGPLLLDVLGRLAGELDGAGVLLVCLARPELLDVRAEPLGEQALSMPLTGLSDQESALLAAELTDLGAHAEHPPTALLERAGGNPLHLEQLLAVAAGSGLPGGLPPTVQAVLGARIDALASPDRGVLDLAAVLGREFTVGELAGLAASGPAGAPDTPDAVRATLLRLTRHRLVEPVPGPRPGPATFRFVSGLVQEVTYQSLSKRARAEGHARAAELPSVRTAGPAAVGGHLEHAHRHRAALGLSDGLTDTLRRRAADALGRAGAQAQARSDLPWAEDLLGRAAALHGADPAEGAAVARRLGETRLALGRTDEGLDLLHRVLATAADPVERAHARLALATVRPGGETPAEAARAALPVFEAARDELGQARACLRLGQRHQAQGRHGEAAALLTRALAHAVRADGEPERAAALGATGISLWRGPRAAAEAVDHCRALLAEHGSRRRTVRLTLSCPLALLLALDDRWDEARASLADAERLAAELGYAEARVFLPVFGSTVEALAGRRDRALALLATATEHGRRYGAGTLLDGIALESARLLVDSGDLERAAPVVERLAAATARPHAEAVELDGLRGRIAAAQGRSEEALRLADQALAAAATTDSPVVRGLAALDHAHTCLLLGLGARAAASAAEAGARFRAKGHRPGVRWAAELSRAAGLSPAAGARPDTLPVGPHRNESP
ncbi:adenylate/guanylate cyclase domain-containing protein [Kitasatospora phosalacinea]|uniref:adenylate/guanylate cyclase domain-containing protein n=1 Tax=Kitasatospora phosalacinea TaxID=2065 RepID=UPI000689FE39|nr:adenylate/guanylate cyclase domain-containing protein [Kitasatospora phosalacinea]